MRLLRYLIVTGILLVPAFVFADDLGEVRLSLTEGDVQVQIKDTTDWTDAAVNLPMNEGDRLWVPDHSQAELQIRGGVFVRGDHDTALDILTVSHDSAQLYLDEGHIYINNRRGGIRTVQVDTPISSLRTYDNSVMMVDVSHDGIAEVSVLKGYVYAESRAGATRVSAGNTLTMRGEQSAEVAPIGPPDDWEQWNMERDRYLASVGESSRYLPDDLHEYASDFDRYGRWEYESDYGYVWLPTAAPAGWAPYSYGSWVWIRGNYVWIDYDPWGWAPSHYGRWAFVGSRGWCWVPPAIGAVYWSPGFVGWIVTPSYVAWVPLAPGEIYYGYGYYGPGSVNITTVNTVVVNRNYSNARVNNSVTVVNRESFGTGKRVPVRRENPFLEMKQQREQNRTDVHVVPPRDRPKHPVIVIPREEHEQQRQRVPDRLRVETPTRNGQSQTPPPARVERPGATGQTTIGREPRASERRLPPERVRRTSPEAVKNERPLVRNRESSVFRQQQPENLPVTRSRQPRRIDRAPTGTSREKPDEAPAQRRPEKRERPGRPCFMKSPLTPLFEQGKLDRRV